jgi:hypothetical protein
LPAAPVPDPIGDAVTVSAGTRRGRIGQAIATGTTIYHLGRQIHGQWVGLKERRKYTVTIDEGDDIYEAVQRAVLGLMPDVDQRAVSARTGRHRTDDIADGDRVVVRKVALHYDGSREQKLSLDGQVVNVRVERDERSTGGTGGTAYQYKPHRVIFSTQDLAGREAIERFLQGVADSLGGEKRVPRLHVAARWGDWHTTRDLTPRRLDSVFLPAGHLDGVMEDLRRFLGAEARYAHLGVPWHRGYLFSGIPGTGKSTTAAAMGTELGMDVFVLSVADVSNNATLNDLVSRVPARSMLLLEDIDVVNAARDREVTDANADGAGAGATLDGLLNALDGLVTPHGLVTVMTTNRRDALDPALVRPGRADKELTMGPLTPETFGRVVEYFTGLPCRLGEQYEEDLGAGAPWPAVTPAQVVGACVERLYEPEAARAACLALLDDTADLAESSRRHRPRPVVIPGGTVAGRISF